MSGQEIFVIIIVALLLFGADKLPEIARGIGKSMRDFRKATDDIKREFEESTSEIRRDFNEVTNSITRDVTDISDNIRSDVNEVTENLQKEVDEVKNDLDEIKDNLEKDANFDTTKDKVEGKDEDKVKKNYDHPADDQYNYNYTD